MSTRQLILELDELDWDTIQNYIANYQRNNKATRQEGTIVPDGDSNLAGAIMAECVRDLQDYRDLFKQNRPLP